MIGDVVLHVIKKSQHFDPAKAKETTWVHHLADNRCRSILTKYQTQKLTACDTVELTPLLARKLEVEEETRVRNSMNAVERVIEQGSTALCNLVEIVLTGRLYLAPQEAYEKWMKNDEEVLEELRKATWECDATLEDFELVLHHAIG